MFGLEGNIRFIEDKGTLTTDPIDLTLSLSHSGLESRRRRLIFISFKIQVNFSFIQCPPLNIITLGQHESENIN